MVLGTNHWVGAWWSTWTGSTCSDSGSVRGALWPLCMANHTVTVPSWHVVAPQGRDEHLEGGCSGGGSWDSPPTSPHAHPAPQQAPRSCPHAQHPASTEHPPRRDRTGCGTPTAHCPLSLPSHCSAAGEFFPEAAQVAYRMWELSAVAKVEVSIPLSPPVPSFCSPPAWDPRLLLSAAGHGQPRTSSALSLALRLLSTPFSSFGAQSWWDITLAVLATPPQAPLTLGVACPACLQCVTHSPGSSALRRDPCSPPRGQGTAMPWATRTLHAAGGTHKRALWDVQERHPEPYVHGEDGAVLGAVKDAGAQNYRAGAGILSATPLLALS